MDFCCFEESKDWKLTQRISAINGLLCIIWCQTVNANWFCPLFVQIQKVFVSFENFSQNSTTQRLYPKWGTESIFKDKATAPSLSHLSLDELTSRMWETRDRARWTVKIDLRMRWTGKRSIRTISKTKQILKWIMKMLSVIPEKVESWEMTFDWLSV